MHGITSCYTTGRKTTKYTFFGIAKLILMSIYVDLAITN